MNTVRKRLPYPALPLLVGLCACAPTLTPEQEEEVKMIQILKADPPPGCQDLGTVDGPRDGDGPYSMKGKAVRKGANYIRLDAVGIRGTSTATVFHCPDANESSSAPADSE